MPKPRPEARKASGSPRTEYLAPGASGLRPGVLSIYQFGRKLLETNDLDPVYVLLQQAGWEPPLLHRWLLAYWCFYHVGTASWIAQEWKDAGRYWGRMFTAASSKEYPRCSERRHFRGDQAIQAYEWLRERGVKKLFAPLLLPRQYTFGEVVDYVQTWKRFGPWISFKVADMLERLGITKVKFTGDDVFLFDSPKQGAHMLWALEDSPHPADNGSKDIYQWAVKRILDTLNPWKAPPRYERYLNVQEAETILCKWASHASGNNKAYHVGEDVAACKKALLRFPKVGLCQTLLQAGRRGGLWG